MTYLLSEEGRRAMRDVATRPVLFAFDFDGTLAPISPHRAAVKIPRSVMEWLLELSKRAPCAIVSGRALADLAARTNGAVPHLIGNHGIQSELAQTATLLWAKGICEGWVSQLAKATAQPLADLGVDVENKEYSLTLHYREASDPAQVRLVLLDRLEQLSPKPRVILGKFSLNLLPPGQHGKGTAILALMHHLRQSGIVFIGDDETDEEAFDLTEGLVMGVRVGRHSESRARFYIKQQSEIEEVLRFLVHRIDRTPESAGMKKQDADGSRNAANGR